MAQLEAIVLAERFYRNDELIAFRSRRVLEVATACLQANSQERLKPVLEAFGILGSNSQQQFNFGDDSDEEDSKGDHEDSDDDLNRLRLELPQGSGGCPTRPPVAERLPRSCPHPVHQTLPHRPGRDRCRQDRLRQGRRAGRQTACGRPGHSDPAELGNGA